jgi:benzoate/toluate 1,2-dioxygenase beta subunit
MMMGEYRLDVQRFFMGRQFHRLVREGDSFRITLKRVNLINCDTAFEAMAVPI